ncbi:Hsp20/alpha crystallin family protein [Spectribacter hydrogenoxidans]|uniref:Hsp20/alpha crystallin family protein n=1 Tax=Spectribacter hydrogenoxidans TaxID=3075608 RepID=A0ABU3BZG7_9GAMM|nr:Hsp20/alpha crystallin family protein [Salinisphaera sp. W335]MDT0634688.1 Hsp20/alpha crystallin family protein [Salinisphaera sp. W335]
MSLQHRFYSPVFHPAFAGLARHDERPQAWTPPVDITETANGYEIMVDVPGMAGDDIDLNLEKGILTISGERKPTSDTGEIRRRERRVGTFERQLALPDSADTDSVTARVDQGVLRVTIDKRADTQPRRITVQN